MLLKVSCLSSNPQEVTFFLREENCYLNAFNLRIVFNEEAEAWNESMSKLNVVDLELNKFRLLAANFF